MTGRFWFFIGWSLGWLGCMVAVLLMDKYLKDNKPPKNEG